MFNTYNIFFFLKSMMSYDYIVTVMELVDTFIAPFYSNVEVPIF